MKPFEMIRSLIHEPSKNDDLFRKISGKPLFNGLINAINYGQIKPVKGSYEEQYIQEIAPHALPLYYDEKHSVTINTTYYDYISWNFYYGNDLYNQIFIYCSSSLYINARTFEKIIVREKRGEYDVSDSTIFSRDDKDYPLTGIKEIAFKQFDKRFNYRLSSWILMSQSPYAIDFLTYMYSIKLD